jgi:hypothetical protein
MDRKGDTQSSASWEAFEDVVSQYHNIISYVNEFIQNALPRFLNSNFRDKFSTCFNHENSKE